MPRFLFAPALRTCATLVALTFLVPLLHGQAALRAKLLDARQCGTHVDAGLQRAAALLDAGDTTRAAAEVQVALQAMGALRDAILDLEALVSVEEHLVPLLAEARREAAARKARLPDVRNYLSIVKVRVTGVRPDSMLAEVKEAAPEVQVYARAMSRVARAIAGQGERVMVRVLEAPELGVESLPRTLRGRLFPHRLRRDLQPDSAIELRLEPKKRGTLQAGGDYWIVLLPAVTAELVPLLVGGAGRTSVLHAARVK